MVFLLIDEVLPLKLGSHHGSYHERPQILQLLTISEALLSRQNIVAPGRAYHVNAVDSSNSCSPLAYLDFTSSLVVLLTDDSRILFGSEWLQYL